MANLEELVTRYGTLKGEMDSYKKQVDEDNKEIKRLMSEQGLKNVSAGGYVATYSVSKSESFDEEKLLSKIEKMTYISENGCKVAVGSGLGVIKLKPYVDMDALENAIYNGHINAVDLADCRITKETAKLLIKKEK